ncbi:MAG: tape measure protein [Treponema sp.]|jgi:tape measure domain-containing protein|nr:tape measure protein [Treponema sp.]
MSGLNITITADTAAAASNLKNLAAGSEELADKLEKANKKLAKANVKDFIENQALATAALQATRGEMGATDASIAAYQRRIESLVKNSLAPESEEVKALQGELAKLQSRRSELQAQADAQAESERRIAESVKSAKDALKQEADVAVKSLDAKTELEKANVRLASRQEELKKQIRSMVESGIKPESSEIKKLEEEYRKLTKEVEENTKAQKAQETAVKGALAALAAIGVAAGAAGAFAIKAAANVEDMTAAFEPMLGGADKARKLVKQLNQEAVSTPFAIDDISAAVRQLMPAFKGDGAAAIKAFRMLGDTAQGNAQKLNSMTSAYTKAMLKGKVSMKELNMMADAGVPIYTELAASMGVSVERMMEMSQKGEITKDNLTDAFKKMTGEGGLFYKGMETSAFTFNSLMLGLQENIGIAAAAIGEKMLPAAEELVGKAGDAVAAFIEWAGEGENLSNLLGNLGVAAAGASAALAAFVAVSKGHAIVTAMAGAVKLLMAAMTSPAGIAALAAGGLAAAIGLYVKAQDEANRAGEIFAKELTETKNKADKLLSAYDKLNPGKALDKKTTEELMRLYPELNGMMDQSTASAKDYAAAIETLTMKKATDEANIWIAKLARQREEYEKSIKALDELRGRIAEYDDSIFTQQAKILKDSEPGFIRIADDWKKKTENTVNQINAILASVGKQLGEDYQIIDIPVAITPVIAPTPERPEPTGETEKNKESDIARILREAREAVEGYGKSEAELTEAKLIGLKATESQIGQYRGLAAELQKLKEAEESRKRGESDTENILNQTQDYLDKLDELRIKNDEIKNDEAQLLELERARALAEIEASKANVIAKEEAADALNEYYDMMVKISNENFDKKEAGAAGKDDIAEFRKRLEERLEAENGNVKNRIAVLKAAANEIVNIEQATDEQRALLEKELTRRIEEEAAKQKQSRIDAALQSLGAVQELTNLFGDMAQQAADEKAEREAARLESEKAAKSKALIEGFNRDIKAEEMTDEAKQQLKEQFLAQYKKNEEDYTKAVEEEEEKRKAAAKGAAEVDKALSAATAAINSYKAFTGALAAFSSLGPFAYIPAGAMLAAGLAQQAKILSTPVTAETGGRFMAPDAGGGVDNNWMRINDGEVVDVTPRGESASPYVVHNVLMVERRVIYDVVNEGVRSGDIRPWANL